MESLAQTIHTQKDSVFILSTTVENYRDVRKLAIHFDNHHFVKRWSVDLDDWEHVLKVVGTEELQLSDVLLYLKIAGYEGQELQA